jgi:hypothetical protein
VSQILLASALTLSYISGVSAAVVTYNWTVGYVNNVNADGLYERTVIGIRTDSLYSVSLSLLSVSV